MVASDFFSSNLSKPYMYYDAWLNIESCSGNEERIQDCRWKYPLGTYGEVDNMEAMRKMAAVVCDGKPMNSLYVFRNAISAEIRVRPVGLGILLDWPVSSNRKIPKRAAPAARPVTLCKESCSGVSILVIAQSLLSLVKAAANQIIDYTAVT